MLLISNMLIIFYHVQLGQVVIPADFSIRLYIVTLVNGSSNMPSCIAQDLRRILCAASFSRNGELALSNLFRLPLSEKPDSMLSISFLPI